MPKMYLPAWCLHFSDWSSWGPLAHLFLTPRHLFSKVAGPFPWQTRAPKRRIGSCRQGLTSKGEGKIDSKASCGSRIGDIIVAIFRKTV